MDRQQEVVEQQKQQQILAPAKPQEDALIKLARKQGMNTQVRQSIFVVLMSSEVRRFTMLVLCRLTDGWV